jgi:hypothetical protein
MEELDKEDIDFLEVLAGRRQGTLGETALRTELLYLAQAIREGDAAARAQPSPAEIRERDRMREALTAAGALPTRRKSKSSGEQEANGFFSGLRGLLGSGKSSTGILSWRGPVGALGWVAVGCVATFVVLPKVGYSPPETEVLRGTGDLTIAAPDTDEKCAELENSLLAAGLPQHQVIVSKSADGCKVVVSVDDPVLQRAAATIFRQAIVKPSARMELSVIVER